MKIHEVIPISQPLDEAIMPAIRGALGAVFNPLSPITGARSGYNQGQGQVYLDRMVNKITADWNNYLGRTNDTDILNWTNENFRTNLTSGAPNPRNPAAVRNWFKKVYQLKASGQLPPPASNTPPMPAPTGPAPAPAPAPTGPAPAPTGPAPSQNCSVTGIKSCLPRIRSRDLPGIRNAVDAEITRRPYKPRTSVPESRQPSKTRRAST